MMHFFWLVQLKLRSDIQSRKYGIILPLPWFYVVIFTSINGRTAKIQVEMRTTSTAYVRAINEGSSCRSGTTATFFHHYYSALLFLQWLEFQARRYQLPAIFTASVGITSCPKTARNAVTHGSWGAAPRETLTHSPVCPQCLTWIREFFTGLLFWAEIRFSPSDRTSCEVFVFSEEIKVGRSQDGTRLGSVSLLTGDVVTGVQSVLASACT